MHNIRQNQLLRTFIFNLLLIPLSLYAQSNPNNPEISIPRTNSESRVPNTKVTSPSTLPEIKSIIDKKIKPVRFEVIGVKSLPFQEVADILKPIKDKEIKVENLLNQCKEVTALYKKNGYPLSFCYIPNQDFDQQAVRIVIVEGFIANVNIEGEVGKTKTYIEDMAKNVLSEKPLTSKTLDRYIGLISGLPGLKIQPTLPLPNTNDGATNLKLVVSKKNFDLVGRLEAIDPLDRIIVTAKSNGLLNGGDELQFSTLLSQQNEQYYAVMYRQPLNDDGLNLKVDVSQYDGNINNQLIRDIDRKINSLKITTTVSYPVILSRTKSLIVSAGLSSQDFEDASYYKKYNRYYNTDTNSKSAILGLSYSEMTGLSSSRLQLSLSKGINSLGSSSTIKSDILGINKKSDIDLDYSKFSVDYIRKTYLKDNWSTVLSTNIQYSPDNLPIPERVNYGGFQFGRGYSPGYISGNSGYAASVEVNKLLPYNKSLPFYSINYVQPYVLIETAKTFDSFRKLENDNLTSLAVGLRLISDKPDRTNIDLSFSTPLTNKEDRNGLKSLGFSVNFGIPLN